MSGINKVMIMGRLGKEPEVSYTQAGMAITKFSLATSDKKKDGTETTQWHNCVSYAKTAETIAKYVQKGHLFFIEGKIQYSQYEKDGTTRYYTSIFVNTFNFLPQGNKEEQYQPKNNQNQGQNQNTNTNHQQNNNVRTKGQNQSQNQPLNNSTGEKNDTFDGQDIPF